MMPAAGGQIQANGLVTQQQLQEAVNALTEVITNSVNQLEEKTKNEIEKVNLQIQATTAQHLEIAANVTRESEKFAGKMGEVLSQLAQAHERVDEQLRAMSQRTEEFKNDGAKLQEIMSGEFQKMSGVQDTNAARQQAAQDNLAQNTEGVVRDFQDKCKVAVSEQRSMFETLANNVEKGLAGLSERLTHVESGGTGPREAPGMTTGSFPSAGPGGAFQRRVPTFSMDDGDQGNDRGANSRQQRLCHHSDLTVSK